MKKVFLLGFLGILFIGQASSKTGIKASVVDSSEKPRIIVTSDGEIDDECSMIRFLLYSNEFDIEGLIYGNSKWQRHGHGTVWMQETIDEWASVLDNILMHQEGYPDPEYLKSICFVH